MENTTSYELDDLDSPIEPCGATENVVHYPCMVLALIVWRETNQR
jgi:hypothetical protein